MRRLLSCAVALAVAGCVRDPGGKAAPGDAAATAAPSPSAAPSADAPRPPLVYAPLPTSAPRPEREARVLALLRGEVATNELPEVATEIGEGLDLGLREELAPRKKTKVQIANVEPTGALGAKAVELALTSSVARLRGCYGRGLAMNPNLTGSVGVELAVAADGRIMNVKNTGTDLPDAGVVQCVSRRLMTVTLPAADAGTTVVKLRIHLSAG